MSRRHFLKLVSASGAGSLFARSAAAQRGDQRPPKGPVLEASVGSLDLNAVDLVDTHVHLPQRMTLKQSYDMWNDSFVDAMVPDYDFPGKRDLRGKLTKEFVDQIWDLPRQ